MGVLLSNKFAHTNYDIQDTLEAGLILYGFEVKSLKQKQGSLKEAYITVEDGEAYLVKAHIPAYQQNNTPDSYDPYRRRKLLLRKEQLDLIAKKRNEAGLTVVPISLYNKKRHLKLEIGIGRGKKKHDKRQDLKARDAKRDIDRAMKGHY